MSLLDFKRFGAFSACNSSEAPWCMQGARRWRLTRQLPINLAKTALSNF